MSAATLSRTPSSMSSRRLFPNILSQTAGPFLCVCRSIIGLRAGAVCFGAGVCSLSGDRGDEKFCWIKKGETKKKTMPITSRVSPDDLRDFPFNSMEYAVTYPGAFRFCRSIASAINIRGIAGTEFCDGRLPWPYVTFPEMGELLVKKEHPDLITISGVIAPSETRPSATARDHELIPFKQHFIFDPSVGSIKLSRKSASNLRKGSKVWRAADAESSAGWTAFADLYNAFILEKGLTGGFYDFDDEHFSRLSGVGSIRLFGVRSSGAWGAMACGARHGKDLHLMHIRISVPGYKSCASYVLMDEIIQYCESNDITLFLGGLRQGADEGLLRFKKRWTNKTLPVWLLKVVARPDIYKNLIIKGNNFFPGYRFP